ncbi:MAG: helix-turn-helix transcriptional regulator [Chloroflexi bacterium]|nr:helix-turn-helix transcriptional regulator [Chloroflexota bacterium]
MDGIRFGRGARALRRRRGWRQLDVARRAGVSQSLVARIERGGADRVTVRTLERVTNALGARVSVRLDFNGEAIDRLLDEDHARLVERIIDRLGSQGWDCKTEVTFSIGGERGSLDVFAMHRDSGVVLVVEAKTVVPDLQAMLAALDRKARLGSRVAGQVGWKAAAVGRLLVVAEDRTSRRRVASHAETFDAALPDRGTGLRQALRSPDPSHPLRGLMFLSGSTHATGRHRVRVRGPAAGSETLLSSATPLQIGLTGRRPGHS